MFLRFGTTKDFYCFSTEPGKQLYKKKRRDFERFISLISVCISSCNNTRFSIPSPERPQNLQAKFQYGLSGHVLESSLINISEETNATKVTILQRFAPQLPQETVQNNKRERSYT